MWVWTLGKTELGIDSYSGGYDRATADLRLTDRSMLLVLFGQKPLISNMHP